MKKCDLHGKERIFDFGKEQRKTGGGSPSNKPSAATAKRVIKIFKETASFTGLSGFKTLIQVTFLLQHCQSSYIVLQSGSPVYYNSL